MVTTSAAAPSTMPEALPAVTNDSGPNAGGSLASASALVLGNRWSSRSTITLLRPCLTSTGTISSAKRPFWVAWLPRVWERSA